MDPIQSTSVIQQVIRKLHPAAMLPLRKGTKKAAGKWGKLSSSTQIPAYITSLEKSSQLGVIFGRASFTQKPHQKPHPNSPDDAKYNEIKSPIGNRGNEGYSTVENYKTEIAPGGPNPKPKQAGDNGGSSDSQITPKGSQTDDRNLSQSTTYNLIGVDIDEPSVVERWLEINPSLRKCLGFEGQRGRRLFVLWMKSPPPTCDLRGKGFPSAIGEFRASGEGSTADSPYCGTYSVVAGVHPDTGLDYLVYNLEEPMIYLESIDELSWGDFLRPTSLASHQPPAASLPLEGSGYPGDREQVLKTPSINGTLKSFRGGHEVNSISISVGSPIATPSLSPILLNKYGIKDGIKDGIMEGIMHTPLPIGFRENGEKSEKEVNLTKGIMHTLLPIGFRDNIAIEKDAKGDAKGYPMGGKLGWVGGYFCTGRHQSNHKLKSLVRALVSREAIGEFISREDVLNLWWEGSKGAVDSGLLKDEVRLRWNTLLRTATPDGVGVAWGNSLGYVVPGCDLEDERFRRLAAVCWLLKDGKGEFFLSVRSLVPYYEREGYAVHHIKLWRWMGLLVELGYLVVVTPGTRYTSNRGDNRATVYRWVSFQGGKV